MCLLQRHSGDCGHSKRCLPKPSSLHYYNGRFCRHRRAESAGPWFYPYDSTERIHGGLMEAWRAEASLWMTTRTAMSLQEALRLM
ncbi:hypothetical protein TNCV_419821 [Trichonephila clavipes]|uniref:Uncharacterized protein n=1 Tax=Trichonephila clavipes TaxID=2585209 RepID=A0A8X6RZM1_TRICX|nr:hypothetical protein TNCV_419821 [Trichonephila clavipes]